MRKYREPLDLEDRRPEEMNIYLSHNRWHFNKKLCEWAISQMRKRNPATDKEERLEPWDKDKVEELLKKYGIQLENLTGYDHVYVCNMARADFYKSSIVDEQHLAMFVKDMVDDIDQADGFIMNRFYADCVRNGCPIPWYEVL